MFFVAFRKIKISTTFLEATEPIHLYAPSRHGTLLKSSYLSPLKETVAPDYRLPIPVCVETQENSALVYIQSLELKNPRFSVAAEGDKKGEKEPHLSQPIGEETEEGEQQSQEEQITEGLAQPSSSTSHPSTHPPSLIRTSITAAEVPPSRPTTKSPKRVLQVESTGQEETPSSSSIRTSSAPSTPSGVSWLAEKAIVLVRFAECFRRGRVIRYDAELNMCVVQLEFSNTVVNKGIEDIFPDDPSVISEAAKKKEEQEKSAQASSSRTTDSDVPCPSSAPPFIYSAPTLQMPGGLSSSTACSPGSSSRHQQQTPISTSKSDERQPSPLSTQSHHPSLPHLMPQGPPVAQISPSVVSRGYSVLFPGECSLTSSAASFQEALRILYQKHTAPSTSTRPGPSTLPPVSAPPFHHQHQKQLLTALHQHSHHLASGHLKRYSTDEVEGSGGPSSTSQDTFVAALAAASARSQPSHPFPRRQSESGLYQLAERMQRYPSGEQMTLKRVRSEQQTAPFSMLGQQPSRPPFSFTMVLGEQVPVADPEQLARNLLFPLLNPPQPFGVTAPVPSSTSTLTPSDSTCATHVVAPPRRTSALDLLLMTEGEACQLSQSMLAGSSLAHPERPSHPTGLTPSLRSFTASTPTAGRTSQVFNFSGASSATTSDVVITPSSVSSSTPVYRPAPSSAGPSTSTTISVPGPSTSTDYHTGFRRSEAAKCRRVYGAHRGLSDLKPRESRQLR
nr:zinc finger protein 395 [Hymenolepis microstoma]